MPLGARLKVARRLNHHVIVQGSPEELNPERKFFLAEPARNCNRWQPAQAGNAVRRSPFKGFFHTGIRRGLQWGGHSGLSCACQNVEVFKQSVNRFLQLGAHALHLQVVCNGELLARVAVNPAVRIIQFGAVAGMNQNGQKSVVVTGSGREIVADGVVAGLGIELNTELAALAGLPIENGIAVDELLRVGVPDIFAAGDVASFHNPALGERIRPEHEDNALVMGRQAGRNMAGAGEPYHHLPFFYSDLFDLGYEAVGILDSRLETVTDWQEPYRKGVVYFLRDGRVRGVLLWNVLDQVDAARQLIAEPGPVRPEDLKGRLPG